MKLNRTEIIILIIALALFAYLIAPATVTAAISTAVTIFLIALASGLLSGLVWTALALVHKVQSHRLSIRIANAKMISEMTIVAPRNSQILVPAGFNWQPLHGWSTETSVLEALPEPVIQIAQPDVISLLAQEQRLFILGDSGSGKSSLLRHVVASKLAGNERVVICDPHGSRPKWGTQVDAVGFGEDWNGILECFRSLEHLHGQRIKMIADGHPERQFDLVTVVVEELQNLVAYFKEEKVDVGKYIRMFLTRTRKTGIDIAVCGNASTVGATGLKGFSQNAGAFSFVRTEGKDGRGHTVLYTDAHGSDHLYDPAPPYWPDTRPVGVQPGSIFTLPVAPSDEEAAILKGLEQGWSRARICKEVLGKSKNGRLTKMIGEVENKFKENGNERWI